MATYSLSDKAGCRRRLFQSQGSSATLGHTRPSVAKGATSLDYGCDSRPRKSHVGASGYMATAAAAVAGSRESGCSQRLSSTSTVSPATYMTTAVDGYRRSWDGLATMSLAASSESRSRQSRDGLGTVTSLAAPIDSGGVGSRCSRDGLGTVPLATSSESGSRRGRDGLGTVSLAEWIQMQPGWFGHHSFLGCLREFWIQTQP